MSINKPFLKWAGGKRQSLHVINEAVGYIKGKFIEPFVGSGIVFLNIDAVSYVVSDINNDLINIYKELKVNGENFIEDVSYLFNEKFNNKESYYDFRDKFNKIKDPYEKSLLFIYLNRHCFNGLCRYNKDGGFNVPFGKYKKVYFPKIEMTSFINRLKNCEIYNQDFKSTMLLAKPDDLCYCDPPYVPLTDTASFTDYSSDGFSMEQQIELAKLAENSCCKVLISNHDTELTRKLYKNADKIITKQVNRFISSNGKDRKPVKELLAIYN